MIGIIAALEEELIQLERVLVDAATVRLGGLEARTGRIGTQDVAIMRCGVGKVAAASATQAMISAFSPDAIVNTGCAGGLASGLSVGDVVLSTATVEWDMDTIALGDPRGYITGMDRTRMEADGVLRERLRRCVPADVNVRQGLIASGDQFVCTPEQRRIILDAFPDALCAEMEGGAVGHVCAANSVPFCVVRCMSDTADGDSKVDFPAFVVRAGKISAGILITMLKD